MKKNKICFIIYGDNDFLCQEALHYVLNLHMPENMELDYMIIGRPDSISEAFNAGMAESDAAYKVYVNENVFITASDFIVSLMNAFENNPDVGMIGALGYHEDTSGDNVGKRRIGCVTAEEKGLGTQLRFFDCEREYGLREASELDYNIVATALDVQWKDDTNASKVMADKTSVLNSRGYKSVVMLTGGSWCLYDNNIIQKSNG
jgi:hypothetical protein